MAVKGKRNNEETAAPQTAPKTKKEKSSLALVKQSEQDASNDAAPARSIGDFTPEDINATSPPPAPESDVLNSTLISDEADAFDSDPDPANNPNILPDSPFAFNKDVAAMAASAPASGGELPNDLRNAIRTPRTPKLPTMESTGNKELEEHAFECDDIDNTIKTLKKRRTLLTDQMLNLMKKDNITLYSHDGYLIEREEKGETVKVKSVKAAEE